MLSGGNSYEFFIDSFHNFLYYDTGNEERYIRVNEEWYQLNKPMNMRNYSEP